MINTNDYPCGFLMDPTIVSLYQMIFKLDPHECELVEGDYKKLEINLSGGKVPLLEFIGDNSRLVTIDQLSTKEVNELALSNCNLPENVKKKASRLYVEIHRFWGLVEDKDDKRLGILNRVKSYNGLPKLITDPEDFLHRDDRNEEYFRVFTNPGLSLPDLLKSEPVEDVKFRIALHRDFLREHELVGGE